MLSQAKDFDAVTEVVGEWTGEEEMKHIIDAIEKNPPRLRRMYLPKTDDVMNESISPEYKTPQNTQNPEPPSSGAPFLPKEFQTKDPLPPKADPVTPTPTVSA
jgi:tRNA-dihydrouridine synthase 2